jgi:hypothetical protein
MSKNTQGTVSKMPRNIGILLMQLIIIQAIDGVSNPSVAASWEKTCRKATAVARSVMGARQRGATIEVVLDAMGNLPKEFVYEAYEIPLYSTDTYKQQAIAQFGNDKFVACAKVFRKK